MEHVKRVKPAIVVVDSFRAFDDLAKSHEELRKFGYAIALNLMAWETTALLLGEYGSGDLATNPLFSVVDGLLTLHQREQSGDQQRFIQISKMRGTEHSRYSLPRSVSSSDQACSLAGRTCLTDMGNAPVAPAIRQASSETHRPSSFSTWRRMERERCRFGST
jgi:KaiC/GvpD/RAD55 family RecA-like ATPase